MAMQKIKFQTNVPVELALKFTDGKLCDSQFGDPQYMFTCTDDRVFFVAEKVAQKIHGMRLKVGERVDICKAEVDYGNGRKGIEWQITRVDPPVGEQTNGTFVVPANGTAVSATAPVAPKPSRQLAPQTTPTNVTPEPEQTPLMPWALFLLSQTKMVIDVYALACRHASEAHGNIVRTDDVRAIMTTCFINLSKQGGAHVA